MFNSLQFEQHLKGAFSSWKDAWFKNTLVNFKNLLTSVQNEEIADVGNELSSLIGCEPCQKFVHWLRSPPVDDILLGVFNQLVSKACLAEYDTFTCENVIEMESQRLKEGLFAVIFTEARICGSYFPVCDVAYSSLESKDYA